MQNLKGRPRWGATKYFGHDERLLNNSPIVICISPEVAVGDNLKRRKCTAKGGKKKTLWEFKLPFGPDKNFIVCKLFSPGNCAQLEGKKLVDVRVIEATLPDHDRYIRLCLYPSLADRPTHKIEIIPDRKNYRGDSQVGTLSFPMPVPLRGVLVFKPI